MRKVLQIEVPYSYLGDRWHSPRASPNAKRAVFTEQHPSPPTISQIASLMEGARYDLWYSHPGIVQFDGIPTVSHDCYLFPEFYQTVLHGTFLTMQVDLAHVGNTSITFLTQLFNQHKQLVGYAVLVQVAMAKGGEQTSKITADNPIRSEVRSDLFEKFCKKGVFRIAHLSDKPCDFSYPILVRPGDIGEWSHVNQSVHLTYAMDVLDAALDDQSLAATTGWVKTLRSIRCGVVESCHNVKWSRFFVQFQAQVQYGDSVEVRVWAHQDFVEFHVIKLRSSASEHVVASRILCWHPLLSKKQAKM
eukprot:TRINITY_DN2635_c0_g1_i1.p1 TRINITY_DN2635_c0_g1~~TRINITY_DN2635_c0_g1_i1.p1  ORF type:complete len:304 (+),score=57.99 TRINITY_DN2635_c0_g1_i1:188-1099(+)